MKRFLLFLLLALPAFADAQTRTFPGNTVFPDLQSKSILYTDVAGKLIADTAKIATLKSVRDTAAALRTTLTNSYLKNEATILGKIKLSNTGFSAGSNNSTNGDYGTGIGVDNSAVGYISTTVGVGNTASGNASTAIGVSNYAIGNATVALGANNYVSGNAACAAGANNNVTGDYSWSSGSNNGAIGAYSTVMGVSNVVTGYYATAMGMYNTAPSFSETTIGRYSISYTPARNDTFDINDRLFTLANGRNNYSKNLLTAHKSNRIQILGTGSVVVPAGLGSISPNAGATLQIDGGTDNPLEVRTQGAGTVGIGVHRNEVVAGGDVYMQFTNRAAGGTLSVNGQVVAGAGGSGVSYLTTSDQRLKNDKGVYCSGLSTLSKIKVHNYEWKRDSTPDVGVFAQELYDVYPLAVSAGDNGAGVAVRWQVDYSKLVPMLISAVQELSAKVKALEAAIK